MSNAAEKSSKMRSELNSTTGKSLGALGLAHSVAWWEQNQGGYQAVPGSPENSEYQESISACADRLPSPPSVSIYVSLSCYTQIHC